MYTGRRKRRAFSLARVDTEDGEEYTLFPSVEIRIALKSLTIKDQKVFRENENSQYNEKTSKRLLNCAKTKPRASRG